MDNTLRTEYRCFCNGIAQFQHAVPVHDLSPTQVNQVLKSIIDAHPEFFWFDGGWTFSGEGKAAVAYPHYLFSREQAAVFSASIHAISSRLIARARDQQFGPFQTARFFFDWILGNVKYGSGKYAGQTIYDALITQEAVCKGLSKAYQLLMQKAGIPTWLAEGTIDGRTKHVWNIVEVNSTHFNVDASMGYDCFSFLFHGRDVNNPYRCFMVSDEQLSHTHRRFIC